jgi:hypothetical protein
MTILDEQFMGAPAGLCFRIAADVERWPAILTHYRWVRFRQKRGFGTGRVEMAAWRPFLGPVRYPTWWVSEMHCDAAEPAVYYQHVEGITRGMNVKWEFQATSGGTLVRITHAWDGPAWPLVGRFAWRAVIAPHFVSAIARRTLAGVRAEAERRQADRPAAPRAGPIDPARQPAAPGDARGR